MQRVAAIARAIGQQLAAKGWPASRTGRGAGQGRPADRHGRRVPGTARHHGPLLRAARRPAADVADAIEDHYKPRFAGDTLPRGQVGTVVALADKLETLVGMFGIGQIPTGDRDPFALRRHALGVIRMLAEGNWICKLID
jgi:glycyl-tRNA synthetase beta chain